MNPDSSRHRDIHELATSIQLERDEIAKLRLNDPTRNTRIARLNGLLGERNRLKDS